MQSDQPIKSASEDRLDRVPFAQRIAEVVSRRTDSATLVVGVYGPWGDGKSSTLSLIKENLRTQAQHAVVVNYNPWFFSSTPENLTRSFFLTLGDALEKASNFSREKIGKLLKNYGSAVPKLGGLLQAVGTTLSVTDLKQKRDQVEAILLKHRTPIIVFVDDIDRLDRAEIQTLFKLIRLSADFPYVVYILAFDDEIVAAALGEAYETGDKAAGRRFLEKIVQTPLHLPKASTDTLRKLTFEAADKLLRENKIELGEQRAQFFANSFALGASPVLSTPRQIKLYENALTFAVPLLSAEVDVADLMLLEAIRTFLPRLYLTIRDNPDAFLKGGSSGNDAEKHVKTLIDQALADLDLAQRDLDAIRVWLIEKLFPRTSSMGYGDEWNAIWGKAKRLCAPDYFYRYFSYGVPTGDIADGLIDRIISAANANDETLLDSCVVGAAKHSAYPILLRKLRTIESDIPVGAATALIRSISKTSAMIPRERGMGMDWTLVQAAVLTTHLAQKFASQSEQFDAIAIGFNEATSFAYLFELLRFARKNEENGKTHGFLNDDKIKTLASIMAAKLVAEADGEPLYRYLGDDTRSVLLAWAWYGDREALRSAIGASIAAEGADGAEYFLEVCAGKGWEMESGIPHISDIRSDTYKTIRKVVDPDLVLAALKERYGDKLKSPKHDFDRDTPTGERLASQFAFLHNRADGPEAEDEK